LKIRVLPGYVKKIIFLDKKKCSLREVNLENFRIFKNNVICAEAAKVL
jgi:hypothetical protein